MSWTVQKSRARRCKRWSLYPPGIVDLTVAEMDLPTAEPIMDCLRDAVERQAFGYPLPDHASRLPAVAASWLADRGLVVGSQQIRLMPDVIKGVVLALQHFTAPDTPIAIVTPTYSRFFDAVDAAGRRAIEVPMRRDESGYRLDASRIEDALRQGARTVLLCNPSNPTGHVFTTAELTELSSLVERYGARTISDEIHAPLCYTTEHVPYASVASTAAAHSITVTSASKAWNIPGLRCALVVLTNPADIPRWEQLPRAAKGGISPLGIEATVAAFTEGQPWLEKVLGILDANRTVMAGHLADAGMPELMHLPESTYLAWFDLRPYGLADARRFLLEEAEVATTGGPEHGQGCDGFVRVNFATPQDVLLTGLDRIVGALRQHGERASA